MELEQELQQIARQEAELVLPRFDEDIAWELGGALRSAALQRGAAIVIDIRRGNDVLFFYAMPGTVPSNADWARRKRNVVELTHRSSYAIGIQSRIRGVSFEERMGLSTRDYACHGGAFPIKVAQAGHVGSIVVSGMQESDDHNLIVDVLTAYLKR